MAVMWRRDEAEDQTWSVSAVKAEFRVSAVAVVVLSEVRVLDWLTCMVRVLLVTV